MVDTMATRRATLALLTILVVAVAGPAAAAPRHGVPRVTISAEGPGTLISLRFGIGTASHVHVLHAGEVLERVALADVDNDGYVDVLAAPRDGAVMLWRNAGHGRFARATLPRAAQAPISRGPRVGRLVKPDEGWQWGDDRYDAAMPRAPDVASAVSIRPVRLTSPLYVRPAPFRRFSGRAPPAR